MTLRTTAMLPLALLLAVVTFGQPNQGLNDQLWEAARTGDATAVLTISLSLSEVLELNLDF